MARTRYRARVFGGVAALFALAVGGAFINVVETRRADATREAAADTATTHAHRLERELRGSLSAAEVLAAALRQTAQVSQTAKLENLDALAAALLGVHQPIGSLQLAPKGVVTRVYPPGAAGATAGRDLFNDPATRSSASEAVQSRRLGILAPVPLPQGGTGILGHLPVFVPAETGERFWGFVLVSIKLPDLLRASQLDGLLERGYHYQLSTPSATSRRRLVLARSTEVDLPNPIHSEIALPNDAAWTLSITPRAGWRSSSLLATELILVLVAAVVVGFSTHRLLQEPEVLRQQVEVRRRRLSDTHQRLQAEVTQRRQIEERLRHEAAHDTLTALPNRPSFLSQVQAALDFTHTSPGVSIAVLFLDLDRFKYVNDSLGHTLGDELLVGVAQRLKECLRPGDVIARVGGDEFAVLLGDIQEMETAKLVADRLLKELTLPFKLGAQEVFTTASIGIAISSPAYRRAEELLRDADTATHRAKSQGRARHQVFDEAMRTRVVRVLELETDLRHAIEREEFRVLYQPIVALEKGEISGSEALVRWQHPTRGFISPMEFIPLAEETGLIVWIDRWVLGEACRQMRAWRAQFPELWLTVSVNVSGRQLGQPHLVDYVAQTLRDAQLDAASLKLEVTESVVMENAEAALEILRRLRDMGVRLLVDDFGTGYSSLSYLERFPFHGVKIDRAFVKDMHLQEKNREIVRTIVRLAHSLGMDVIAEGVETAEHLARLRETGCGYGQGYFFSKPVDAGALERLISGRPQW